MELKKEVDLVLKELSNILNQDKLDNLHGSLAQASTNSNLLTYVSQDSFLSSNINYEQKNIDRREIENISPMTRTVKRNMT